MARRTCLALVAAWSTHNCLMASRNQIAVTESQASWRCQLVRASDGLLQPIWREAGPHGRCVAQVIMATNRIESLDPALIRPGRIDRKIEFPLPDTKTKRRIFGIHTSKMTLAPDVNLEEFIMAKV